MAGISFDFTTGTLPGAITFTRSSIGTYVNNTGTLITASNNVARFNYVSGVSCLLIEGSATNLFAQSNSFTAAPWATAIGAVLTAAQFVSPDGANTGWSMTSGSGYGYCYQPINLSNIPYMCSIWAKQITGDALVGLTLNNVNTTIVPSATLTRVFSAITPLAGYTSCYFQVVTGNSGYVQGYYGIQVETGSVMTSYIPTGATTVTRAADAAVFTIPAGVSQLTYTFDDNSTQLVAVSPGSYTIPVTLNRPNIKTIVGVGANNPVPTITSLSPSSVTAGTGALTLTVNGTNFVIDSVVNWNGAARATTYVSATQLTAAILAGDVATAGTASVTVFNTTPGGGTSGASTFTINAANNPVPAITSLAPNATTAGSGALTLTVNGTNFISTSVVKWNGATRTTTFVSATQLTAAILAGDVATAGTASVTVFSPTPGGGTSGASTFTINAVVSSGGVITLQCAACGFYMKTTNPHDANIIAAKHTAGWGPAHVVSVTGTGGGSINFDFTSGSLPAGITFTRASTGTYNSSGNILTTASNDVARFNYVGGVACLLVEPNATNLLVQSNNFSHASWLSGGSPVITGAQFISPDGTNTGWSMTSGIGNGVIYQTPSYLSVPYVISIWAKRIIGSAPIELLIDGGSSGNIVTSATITRFSFTATPSDTTGTAIRLPVPSGSTNGIYGVQLETGSTPTSYISTTAAAVTRQADSATFTIPSGIGHLMYTFDDNSTQSVVVSAGSYTIPATLNRSNIKSIVGSA